MIMITICTECLAQYTYNITFAWIQQTRFQLSSVVCNLLQETIYFVLELELISMDVK